MYTHPDGPSILLPRPQLTGFDDFTDEVRAASCHIIATAPPESGWSLERRRGEAILVQFGSEGGERILHGRSQDELSFVTRPSAHGNDVRVNGRPAEVHDFVVIPPGVEFISCSREPHDWIAVSIVPAALDQPDHPLHCARDICLGGTAMLAAAPFPQVSRFRETIDRIDRTAAPTANPQDVDICRDLADDIVATLAAAIIDRDRSRDIRQPGLNGAEALVHKALRLATADEWSNPSVEWIAASSGVSERTLLRAFQSILGMGPAHYLKLRTLNAVRRYIAKFASPDQTITALLTGHGVTEFGRFAGEYKRLFGETPSQTLAKRHFAEPRCPASGHQIIAAAAAGAAGEAMIGGAPGRSPG